MLTFLQMKPRELLARLQMLSMCLGKSAQFELPGKFMKVSYNDSLSD